MADIEKKLGGLLVVAVSGMLLPSYLCLGDAGNFTKRSLENGPFRWMKGSISGAKEEHLTLTPFSYSS